MAASSDHCAIVNLRRWRRPRVRFWAIRGADTSTRISSRWVRILGSNAGIESQHFFLGILKRSTFCRQRAYLKSVLTAPCRSRGVVPNIIHGLNRIGVIHTDPKGRTTRGAKLSAACLSVPDQMTFMQVEADLVAHALAAKLVLCQVPRIPFDHGEIARA
jgi:hypothetical protein